MKGIIVLVLVLSAIVTATILHNSRPITGDDNSGIDANISILSEGLKGMGSILPPNANISIKTAGVSPTTYLWCRYILAAPYCPADKKDKCDTVITICSLNLTDSVLHAVTGDKKVIWHHKDGRYEYFLTCKH